MKTAKPILLALVCALLLGGMHRFSKEQISLNKQQHAEQILRDMLPAGDMTLIKTLVNGNEHYRVLKLTQQTALSRSQQKPQPIGSIWQQHTLQGYNGHIAFWVAVGQSGEVLSVRTFAHQETPGIGDKIDHEVSGWIDLFKGLSLANTHDADWAVTQDGGRFDGITGATITSRASIQAVHAALLLEGDHSGQSTEETQ